MDSYPYIEGFEVKERLERPYREAEQWRLGQLAKAQNDGRQGQWLPSSKALWNSLAGWAGRTVASLGANLSDARSWWSGSRQPEEQCC